jgi:hypothetical protein
VNTFKKCLLGSAGVVVVSLVVTLSGLGEVFAQAAGAAAASGGPHFTVDNTAANPVPVVAQGTTSVGGTVSVTNAATNPVPVREQDLDAAGNIKVHELGTANVNVTNNSLAVKLPAVTDGAEAILGAVPGTTKLDFCDTSPCTATALVITMTPGVTSFALTLSTSTHCQVSCTGFAAAFPGPAVGGTSTIVLSLSRPITFDTMSCNAQTISDRCAFGFVGGQP